MLPAAAILILAVRGCPQPQRIRWPVSAVRLIIRFNGKALLVAYLQSLTSAPTICVILESAVSHRALWRCGQSSSADCQSAVSQAASLRSIDWSRCARTCDALPTGSRRYSRLATSATCHKPNHIRLAYTLHLAFDCSHMTRTADSDSAGPRDFRTTHWSVVLAAKRSDSPERMTALTALCQGYWYPLYAFVRRQGRDRHQAEDLTQEFFTRLLEKNTLASVQPEQGRFRSFLLASLKNFLANDWDRSHTAKRGGAYSIISWDDQSGEDRYLREPSDNATPEKLFEQAWALTLIQTVLDQMKKEYADAGKSQLFESLHASLSEDEGAGTYAEIAAKLNMTEGAIKMSVLRIRRRFGWLLRAEISQTLPDPKEVEEELRHLFTCLGR